MDVMHNYSRTPKCGLPKDSYLISQYYFRNQNTVEPPNSGHVRDPLYCPL